MSDVAEYVKLPVTIEAIRWTGDNFREMQVFAEDNVALQDSELVVVTLEDQSDLGKAKAKHVASVGDWLIKGIAGEFYFCKPDIFEQSYRKVAKSARQVLLRSDGLLWFINRSLFHPRGFALALDEHTAQLLMYGDGKEVWHYDDSIDEDEIKERLEAMFARIAQVPEDE